MQTPRIRRRLPGTLLAALSLAALLAGPSAADPEQSRRVTIFARPTTIGWADPTHLFGTAQGARLGDTVTVEARECGTPSFQVVTEVRTNAGGGWSIGTGALITTTFRAGFRGVRSNEVTVRQGPLVVLERERMGRDFVVTVTARKSFWRKQVLVQRRTRSSWRTVRRVVLDDSLGLSGTLSASAATFPLRMPKGSVLRALVPAAQAKPCYRAAASRSVRA